jgi:hypothetical protein
VAERSKKVWDFSGLGDIISFTLKICGKNKNHSVEEAISQSL